MPTFYDENNISTKHNKTNVRIKQQKQTLLINQKSQDLPVLKIPLIRNGKKREKMIKRQKFPSASVWLRLHPKHFAMYSKNSIVGTYISSIFCKNTIRSKNKNALYISALFCLENKLCKLTNKSQSLEPQIPQIHGFRCRLQTVRLSLWAMNLLAPNTFLPTSCQKTNKYNYDFHTRKPMKHKTHSV